MRTFVIISIISLLLSPLAQAASVLFIDGPEHRYLRHVAEAPSLLDSEVGAAVSVLLGFAPPTTLTADGSSKLNKILKPNPFERPHAVFLLEVMGLDCMYDASLKAHPNHAFLGNALRSDVVLGSDKAEIQLPDESEVSVVSLDEPTSGFTDEVMNDFASWLGGSYTVDPKEPMTGLLSIPLENGANVEFHLAKKAEREFALSLLVLSHNIRREAGLHEDLAYGMQKPAELMTACFTGIKALREEYGAEGVAKKGMEILLATLSKLFDSLETSHKGQIVGVIIFNGRSHPESQKLLNVVYSSRSHARWLAESEKASNSTLAAEVLLVRTTIAWLTGIILLIATLLGVHFLLNMPLTRDTLLYSNVKLD